MIFLPKKGCETQRENVLESQMKSPSSSGDRSSRGPLSQGDCAGGRVRWLRMRVRPGLILLFILMVNMFSAIIVAIAIHVSEINMNRKNNDGQVQWKDACDSFTWRACSQRSNRWDFKNPAKLFESSCDCYFKSLSPRLLIACAACGAVGTANRTFFLYIAFSDDTLHIFRHKSDGIAENHISTEEKLFDGTTITRYSCRIKIRYEANCIQH